MTHLIEVTDKETAEAERILNLAQIPRSVFPRAPLPKGMAVKWALLVLRK